MARSRILCQRPLKVQMSPIQKMSKALEELRHEKMIRKMVLEAAHRHGFDVGDDDIDTADD